jgi:hypothetical protein
MIRSTLLGPTGLLLATLATATAGCDTSSTSSNSPCDVSLHALTPAEAWVGDRVDLTGRPFTSAYDTAVYVGSARATILELGREGCEACDTCLDEQNCSGCDDCDACDPLCADCVETVSFLVPDQEPGVSSVQLFNRHGESDALELEILGEPEDTAPQDTAPQDTDDDTAPPDDSDGDTDGDTADSANPDTDAPDSGDADTGPAR